MRPVRQFPALRCNLLIPEGLMPNICYGALLGCPWNANCSAVLAGDDGRTGRV